MNELLIDSWNFYARGEIQINQSIFFSIWEWEKKNWFDLNLRSQPPQGNSPAFLFHQIKCFIDLIERKKELLFLRRMVEWLCFASRWTGDEMAACGGYGWRRLPLLPQREEAKQRNDFSSFSLPLIMNEMNNWLRREIKRCDWREEREWNEPTNLNGIVKWMNFNSWMKQAVNWLCWMEWGTKLLTAARQAAKQKPTKQISLFLFCGLLLRSLAAFI